MDTCIVILWRPAIVDLDQADASGIIHSGEQRGVWARWQHSDNAGLQWTCRLQSRSDEFGGLGGIVLPVVIRADERSIDVTQLQGWIGQLVGHRQAPPQPT